MLAQPNYFGPEPNDANSPVPLIQTAYCKPQVTGDLDLCSSKKNEI